DDKSDEYKVRNVKLMKNNNKTYLEEMCNERAKVTVNKRKKVSNCTNIKKRREYEKPNDEPSLRPVETNISAEDHELQAMNIKVIANNDKEKNLPIALT
ncbi:29086_t:CDS:2, partial [Racocetra persica]